MTTQDMNTARRMLIAILLATGSVCAVANATPEGGDVIEGDADIDYGDWTRVITGEITVIQWLSFQIAAGETVEFIMPSETSRVLNLINSGVPTEIMGNLIANGQVFLVNPSGVIFGQGAVVNVGSLYAAAGNISTTDFVNGVYRFTDARGVVENRGLLQGNLIALVGGRVANHGTISAPGGTVILAAGEQVLIGEHLGHLFVELEKPTDLANTDMLSDPGIDGIDLAAGDVFSLAAWNTGTIDAQSTTVAVSAGHSAIDHLIEAGDITLIATGDSYIELGGDLHAYGDGVWIQGDLVLTDDVQINSTGNHGIVAFEGRVDSQNSMEHDLIIDAGNGLVSFTGSVGNANESSRLGVLDVRARKVQIHDDVSVNQEMNFYAPVEIMGDSTTFDVGFGTALFGDNIYSHRDGVSDVAFVYDGNAWVGSGEARTPFKFQGGIGVGPLFSGTPSGGAFRNIRFGGDLNDPSRVSAFLFGTGAQAGLELMHSSDVDLSMLFQVSARESIIMGQGQKMVSFGSLSLSAKGRGTTLVEVGDLNVLGDLRITSQGREGGFIHILDRDSGEIDYTGNESDRDLAGLLDSGTELIASGSIVLDGELVFGSDVTLGASSVQLLNNTGAGDAGTLDIGLFPGGVSLDLFRGVLSGTDELLYPYDLTPQTRITNPQANLATALTDEGPVNLRTDDPLNAALQVLQELTLNPQSPAPSMRLNQAQTGAGRFDEQGRAAFGITIDRLSRSSVLRLTHAYVGLLGQREGDGSVRRVRDEQVSQTIGWVWLQTNGKSIESVHAYAIEHDFESAATLHDVQMVLDAIGLLELTPIEIERAQLAFLSRIKPDVVPMDVLVNQWFSIGSSQVGLR